MWRNGSPQLVSGTDVLAGKERDVREAQVLVGGEHSAGEQVRLAVVVYKPADVAIETCVYTVHITDLRGKKNKKQGNVSTGAGWL